MSTNQEWSRLPAVRFALSGLTLASCLLSGLLSGCGTASSPTPEAKDASTSGDRGASADEEPAPKSRKSKSGTTARTGSAKGKKSRDERGPHLGEIPRDAWPEVFFDEPLSVYAEKGGAASVAQRPSTEPTADANRSGDSTSTASENRMTSPAGAATDDWSSLLTGEVLANETKAIKSSLTEKLQSVGKYSGNYKELRVDAATLAVLAGIAPELTGGPSWTPNARYIRDAAAEMTRSASANGDKYYKPTRAAFDRVDALFSGSKPPDVEEAAEKLPFSELVGRTPLMFRMDRAFNYLKLNVNTEAAFKKEAAKVTHEGSVLAALARVVAAPTYDDADLDDYQKFARELQQCGIGVAEAVRNGDYAAYTAALDRGSKACTDCHSQFKNN